MFSEMLENILNVFIYKKLYFINHCYSFISLIQLCWYDAFIIHWRKLKFMRLKIYLLDLSPFKRDNDRKIKLFVNLMYKDIFSVFLLINLTSATHQICLIWVWLSLCRFNNSIKQTYENEYLLVFDYKIVFGRQ